MTNKSVLCSIRIPKELHDRILELSMKRLISKSEWIITALKQRAYQHKDK